MIYAVEILDRKFVKIGFSGVADVQQRIDALQTGNPYRLSIVALADGTLMQEKALHASLTVAFGRLMIPVPPNEWYPGRHPFMTEFIDALKFGPNVALEFSERYNPAVKQPGRSADPAAARREWPIDRADKRARGVPVRPVQ